MVTGVSADQDSGNLSSIIGFVNVVLIAENVDVVSDGGSSLLGLRPVHLIGERSDSVDGGSVNSMSVVGVGVIGLSQVSSIPVLAKGLGDSLSSILVSLSSIVFTDVRCEFSCGSESIDITHASPEEVSVSSFFPEVTAILLPVGSNPF